MSIYYLINNYIDSKRPYIIDFTKRLIEVPTVNPPGENYEELTGILENQLRGIGLAARRVLTPNRVLKKFGIIKGSKRVNLVADWKMGFKKTLHINGHYDVVPAIGDWKTPPFKAVLKKGRLYGRGSEDMKGTISSIILAVSALRYLNIKPRVNLQLSFTPDEEIGGMTGFGWLVKSGIVKADYGMSEGYADDYVSCGNKGILWAKIDCLGRAAHASVPYKGVNSFDSMLIIANELKRLSESLKKTKTRFKMKREKDRYPTLVMGGELDGGKKVNIIPDMTSFSIDRRLIPEEDLDGAEREIRSAIKAAEKGRGYKFKMRVLARDEAVAVDTREKICRVIKAAIKKVLKKDARFSVMSGGTDMRYLIKKGIPSVGYSAKGGESWHSNNEFVYVKSIMDTAKIYALTILGL